MTIEEAQITVDQWIKEFGVKYFSELTNMAILTEEVGEVARIISRRYGDQSFKESDKERDLGDRNGRCFMGTSMPCQSNRNKPHGSIREKSPEKNKSGQRETHQ